MQNAKRLLSITFESNESIESVANHVLRNVFNVIPEIRESINYGGEYARARTILFDFIIVELSENKYCIFPEFTEMVTNDELFSITLRKMNDIMRKNKIETVIGMDY